MTIESLLGIFYPVVTVAMFSVFILQIAMYLIALHYNAQVIVQQEFKGSCTTG